MEWVAVRKGHHVLAVPHVDLVCLPPEVIGSVVDACCVPLLKAVAMDIDFVALVICEVGRLGFILPVKDPSE